MLHVELVHIGEMLLTVSTLLKKSGVSMVNLEYITLYQTHTSLISVNVSATIALSTNEVSLVGDWSKDSRTQIPKLPEDLEGSFLTMHNKSLIVGGRSKDTNKFYCLELDHGTWMKHSTLNEDRSKASVVTADMGTFVFGGKAARRMDYEYLPNGSTSWKVGKSRIPLRVNNEFCCAITIPLDEHIWLIGASSYHCIRLILKFNINTHTFQELDIATEHFCKRCIAIPGTKKILITGDTVTSFNKKATATEILDTENETISNGPFLKIARANYGIGIITIDSEDRIAVFGGKTDNGVLLDSVEVYNTKIEKWTLTNMRLKKADVFHGNVSLTGKIISDLLG